MFEIGIGSFVVLGIIPFITLIIMKVGLKEFKIYRILKGGEWHFVMHRRLHGVGPYWGRPEKFDKKEFKILKKEGGRK